MQCTHQSRRAIKVLLPRSIKQHFTATDGGGWGISCGRGWIYGLQTNNSTGRRGDAFDLFVPPARNSLKDPIPLIHGHLCIHMWIRLVKRRPSFEWRVDNELCNNRSLVMSPGFLSLRMTSLLNGWHFANIFYNTIKALLVLPEAKTTRSEDCLSQFVHLGSSSMANSTRQMDGWIYCREWFSS